MTRSRFFMTAAVSLKSLQPLPSSAMGNPGQLLELFCAVAFLQAYEPYARHTGQRFKMGKGKRTAFIGAFESGSQTWTFLATRRRS